VNPDAESWLFGGGALFHSLLGAGLVDGIDVAVVPVFRTMRANQVSAGKLDELVDKIRRSELGQLVPIGPLAGLLRRPTLHPERSLGAERCDPAIADGHPMRIASQVLQH
jgi:hypothetical protein